MKKILVTGGAGFVGSHLCECLLNKGNNVICLDDFSSGAVCMVLASDIYKKEDYIRDYQEFLDFRKQL